MTLTALLDGEITAIHRAVRARTAKAGETLAELDARQPRALLEKVRAERDLARLELDAARSAHERLTTMPGDVSEQQLEDSALAPRSRPRGPERGRVERAGSASWQLANARVRAPFAGTVTGRDAEVGQWVEAGTRLFTLVAHDGRVVEAQVDATDFERVARGQAATLATESAPRAALAKRRSTGWPPRSARRAMPA